MEFFLSVDYIDSGIRLQRLGSLFFAWDKQIFLKNPTEDQTAAVIP